MIFGSVYGLLHFMNRNMANDMPQLLATQAAKVVDAYGVEAVNAQPTDLANDPVPFVIVYDKQSKPLAGTGYLDNKLAQMPVGVINHARANDPHAVTWQPQKGTRLASVTVLSKKGYYVVGGQSLKVYENRDKRLALYTFAAYIATLLMMCLAAFIARRMCRPMHNQCACMHGGSCTCKSDQCVCQIPSEKVKEAVAPKKAKTKKS